MPPKNDAIRAKPGRPSLKDELWHKEKWEQDTELGVLTAKIASGKFSIRDKVLHEALTGNKEILRKFMDKCLADLHEMSGPEGAPLFLPAAILEKNNLDDCLPQSTGGDSKGQA